MSAQKWDKQTVLYIVVVVLSLSGNAEWVRPLMGLPPAEPAAARVEVGAHTRIDRLWARVIDLEERCDTSTRAAHVLDR
jgi:hypothetical protein